MNKLILLVSFIGFSFCCSAQTHPPASGLKLLGTRGWVRVTWRVKTPYPPDSTRIYWSTEAVKARAPSITVSQGKTRYYIRPVKPQTQYHVWVDFFYGKDKVESISGKVTTVKGWSLAPEEASQLDVPSSSAVPAGMQLFWHDEFNDLLLNPNKWFATYYSTINFLHKENYQAMRHDSLPQAAYRLNGRYIDLFTNDSLPARGFSGKRKISSIQTYNWNTNENLLNNSRGGYFEVRVRRGSAGNARGVNTAFWFDSPGPDLKYYLPQGVTLNGTTGIRPKGQLFEIDMFEYLTAQFVMHGKVDSNGRFLHNLATDIAKHYEPEKYVPGKDWVTFGLLWTPVCIKHYINGKLIKSYDNKHHIYSPNHFMNVLLGSYGEGGRVSLQVDYIRYYRWPISDNNELPNSGFEANNTILPWEGTGSLSTSSARTGTYGLLLEPNQRIVQYVYLNNNTRYQLNYWCKGKGEGKIRVKVNNVRAVTGKWENTVDLIDTCQSSFSPGKLHFKTGRLPANNMKTIRISFVNTGNSPVSLDDISVAKVRGQRYTP